MLYLMFLDTTLQYYTLCFFYITYSMFFACNLNKHLYENINDVILHVILENMLQTQYLCIQCLFHVISHNINHCFQ